MGEYNSKTIIIKKENWFEVPTVTHAGNGKSAVITCPFCQTQLNLTGTHDVISSGQVVPSVKCPNCEFHNDVRLEGWN